MTRRDWLTLAALLLVITILALPILTYPPGRDQGEFATIGRGILDGKVPYVDLWNPKPPAVFYVYALAIRLFGRTAEALRLIDLLIVPVIGAGLAWLGTRIANRRVGLFAALIFAAFYFTESFWTLTQNDGIVLLPMVLAMVCVFKAGAASGIRALLWSVAAGALSAYVVWFKYPFVLFGLVTAAGLFLTQGRAKTRRSVIKAYTAYFGGAAIVIVGGILYLAEVDALDALIESARVTSQYTALTFNWQDFSGLMQTALGFRWTQWGLLWILAVLWFVWGRPGEREWRLVTLWLVAALIIMLVQAKGYDYHWLPMLPPLALMAADTVDRLIQWAAQRGFARRSELPAALLTVLIFLAILYAGVWPKALPYLTGRESQVEYFSRFQAGEFMADESLRVAVLLRERVVPGDSLYIWGFRPEVYYLSQLNPATRFIFHFPLVGEWYPVSWRQENVDTLWAALPPYVLVLQVDYMPWVTGRNADSNTLLQEYNELNDWLIFNYEYDSQIGNFFLWRRKLL